MSLLSKINQMTGWTPVGRLIEINIDESGIPELIGQRLKGKVVRLNNNKSAALELRKPITQETGSVYEVVAIPRHVGFDWFHIRFGAIAIDLAYGKEEANLSKIDLRFARGLARIARIKVIRQ